MVYTAGMDLMVPLTIFAGLLSVLGGYVLVLVRTLQPQKRLGPDPLEFADVEITPDTWNPPGGRAYAALMEGP